MIWEIMWDLLVSFKPYFMTTFTSSEGKYLTKWLCHHRSSLCVNHRSSCAKPNKHYWLGPEPASRWKYDNRLHLRQCPAGLCVVFSACFTKPGVFGDLVGSSFSPPMILTSLTGTSPEAENAAEADRWTQEDKQNGLLSVEDTDISWKVALLLTRDQLWFK